MKSLWKDPNFRKNIIFKISQAWTEERRKLARQKMINYNNSEDGKQHLAVLHKSEGLKEHAKRMGKAYGAKNLAKANFLVPTESQQILSKALSNNGIDNQLEWWIPECRRIIDIAILSNKIAIEVDGSSHDGMFCTKEQKQADDELKDQQLQSLGWKVLRVINDDVNKNLCDIIKIIKGE